MLCSICKRSGILTDLADGRKTCCSCAYEQAQHAAPQPSSASLAARKRKNAARRARHQAMKDLGLVRVRGALGGVYYE